MSETADPQIAAAVQAELDRRALAARLDQAVADGRRDYGREKFDDHAQAIADVAGNGFKAVQRALAAVPHAHRVVAALADDLDEAERVAKLPAPAMAAELGRIAARVAPPPPAPRAATKTAGPNLYDAKTPMADYVKQRNEQWAERLKQRRGR